LPHFWHIQNFIANLDTVLLSKCWGSSQISRYQIDIKWYEENSLEFLKITVRGASLYFTSTSYTKEIIYRYQFIAFWGLPTFERLLNHKYTCKNPWLFKCIHIYRINIKKFILLTLPEEPELFTMFTYDENISTCLPIHRHVDQGRYQDRNIPGIVSLLVSSIFKKE
jgi:hypothetical protein